MSETRWRSPAGSPLPLRSNFGPEEPQCISGNTSPIILQRFYHQQKQKELLKEAEESAKSDPCKFEFYWYILFAGRLYVEEMVILAVVRDCFFFCFLACCPWRRKH